MHFHHHQAAHAQTPKRKRKKAAKKTAAKKKSASKKPAKKGPNMDKKKAAKSRKREAGAVRLGPLFAILAVALLLCGCEALGIGPRAEDQSRSTAPTVNVNVAPVSAHGNGANSGVDPWSEARSDAVGNRAQSANGNGSLDPNVEIPNAPPPEPISALHQEQRSTTPPERDTDPIHPFGHGRSEPAMGELARFQERRIC